MDAMEKGHTYLRKVNKHWNKLLTLFSNDLNGRSKTRKMDLQRVPKSEKDGAIVT
jgi:hypothetical protein